jgi:hypothetical protein
LELIHLGCPVFRWRVLGWCIFWALFFGYVGLIVYLVLRISSNFPDHIMGWILVGLAAWLAVSVLVAGLGLRAGRRGRCRGVRAEPVLELGVGVVQTGIHLQRWVAVADEMPGRLLDAPAQQGLGDAAEVPLVTRRHQRSLGGGGFSPMARK